MAPGDSSAGQGDVQRALLAVPRAEFVPPDLREEADADRALPIDCGQTISQPAVVAYMTEQLAVGPGDRVLEVGTGSGYQAAVLAELGVEVFSTERIPELARSAAARLGRLGYEGVRVRCCDGRAGWPEEAPFDGIIVTAAGNEIPPALLEQLKPRGRLVIPLGPAGGEQYLLLVHKDDAGRIGTERLWPVRFVPLLRGVAAG